jgi:cytochrome oxidase assembly protein ShyY1
MMRSLAMDDRQRRRRARNWALLAALVGFAALIYLITLVKMGVWQ